MNLQALDARLRAVEDRCVDLDNQTLHQMTPDIESRIASLETTRAFHADTLKRLADRIDKLSDAFRARTDELAGLLESAINLGQHQASQQTDGNLRLGVSMDAMQESLIRLHHDTANRIAGLSIDVRSLSNAVVRLDNDGESIHAEMQSRIEQLSDRISALAATVKIHGEKANHEIGKLSDRLDKLPKSTGEFIRYTHAEDLRVVIREVMIEDMEKQFREALASAPLAIRNLFKR